jgi:hypothetical protein
MDTEQWLEEAMVMTNRSLHLMPSTIFKQSLESCRNRGVSLAAIANASNQLGLIDEKRLLELKERIPEPTKTPPRPDDVAALKQTYRKEIATCRFWMNCMIGMAKEIPVVTDSQPADEKAGGHIREVICSLVNQVITNNREARKGDKDGNGNNNPS